MNNRQAKTLTALIVALIVTQIVCTGLILSGQERANNLIKPLPSQIVREVRPEAQPAVQASDESELLEAEQQLADAEREITDQKSEMLETIAHLKGDNARLEDQMLNEKFLRTMDAERSAAINQELAHQNERMSRTILIPLAK